MRHADDNLCDHADSDEIAALTFATAAGTLLTPEEQGRLAAALSRCPGCRARQAQYAQLAQLLPLSVPDAEPPPALRGRIIEAAARGAATSMPAPPRSPRFAWRRLLLPTLSLALVGLLLWNVMLQRTVARQQEWNERYTASMLAILGDSDAREFHLIPPNPDSKAYGRLFLAAESGVAGVYVKRLPALAPGRSYHVWLRGAERTLSLGSLQVNAEGRAWLIAEPGTPLLGYTSAFVTDEPAGGSASPTGTPQLVGDLATP
jgi:hypothetical protein